MATNNKVSEATFTAITNLRNALRQNNADAAKLAIYGNLPEHIEDAYTDKIKAHHLNSIVVDEGTTCHLCVEDVEDHGTYIHTPLNHLHCMNCHETFRWVPTYPSQCAKVLVRLAIKI